MGLRDLFTRKSADPTASFTPSTPLLPIQDGTELLPALTGSELTRLMRSVGEMSPAMMWATQPNVRACVDYLAMQISHLGLQIFERDANGDKKRVYDSNTGKVLSNPNPEMTGTELIRALASDIILNDEAWWLHRPTNTKTGFEIRPMAVDRVSIISGWEIDGDMKAMYAAVNAPPVIMGPENYLHFKGWTPHYGWHGKSVVITLRDVLAEQVASAAFRRNMWARGGQMGAYIARPQTAADWSPEARDRFNESMKAYRSGGAKAGSMPLLEDGMELRQNRFSAKEEQWLEAIQLSLETVCRAFHLNPAMVGSTGGISYANMKEFRTLLYGETLGPRLRMIEDRLTTKLVPILDPGRDLFVEFNIQQKLAGDFQDQASILSTAVGAPWKTRNEARQLENLPPVEGGDELITPLNVLEGGQANPQTPAPPKALAVQGTKAAGPVEVEGAANQDSSDQMEQVLTRFFKRQQASVLAKINAKADQPWWDEARWNTELSADIYQASLNITQQVATDLLDAAGQPTDAYNVAQTEAFLQAVADDRAASINNTTRDQIQAAIDDPGDDGNGKPVRTPDTVFAEAGDSRLTQIAGTLLTTYAAFATIEAGQQTGGGKTTKTWVVKSSNPRSSHARMDGETVPVGEQFSNRAKFPGDSVLGVDGVAGCTCVVRITYHT